MASINKDLERLQTDFIEVLYKSKEKELPELGKLTLKMFAIFIAFAIKKKHQGAFIKTAVAKTKLAISLINELEKGKNK